MPVQAGFKLEAMMAGATMWSDLTPDLIAPEGVRLFYGIDGNGPNDNIAGVGELQFTLRNDIGNSGGVLGYYSPNHASKRAGWTFGIRVRLVLYGTLTASITSLTRSGKTATVTTSSPHGLTTGQFVTVAGASPTAYNGAFQVTVTGASTFTYQLEDLGGFKAALPFIFSTPTLPASPATGTITWNATYEKFNGRIRTILAEPGQRLSRRVRVIAHDAFSHLMESKIRELALHVDASEATLIEAVLDALPADAQPFARDIDDGVDVFPFAFDNIRGGVQAGGLLKDLVQSSYGLVFMKGDGTFVYRNRHSRATAQSVFTLDDSYMTGLEVPSSLDNVYPRAQATIHPKTVDTVGGTVLFAASGTPIKVGPGETREVWGDYRDPDQTDRLIGGYFDGLPPVFTAGTDWAANTMPDGSGEDATANVTVSVDAFASTAKFTIQNNHGQPVYLVNGAGEAFLQLRGKGLYDDGPQTFTEGEEGERSVEIDMPYQDNPFIGQSAATYVQAQYGNLDKQLQSLTFFANRDATLLTQAFLRDPGDVVTVSEAVTGVASVAVAIQRVELDLTPAAGVFGAARCWITCRWGVAPSSGFPQWWELGVAGRGELGETTFVSF
jgi:hypothetical protein